MPGRQGQEEGAGVQPVPSSGCVRLLMGPEEEGDRGRGLGAGVGGGHRWPRAAGSPHMTRSSEEGLAG